MDEFDSDEKKELRYPRIWYQLHQKKDKKYPTWLNAGFKERARLSKYEVTNTK